MKFSTLALFSSQLLLATSLPLSGHSTTGIVPRNDGASHSAAEDVSITKRIPAEGTPASPEPAASEGAAGEAKEEAGGEGAAKEQEIEGQFTVPVRLGGANVKQDVLFPPGKNGRFEVEFQNAVGRTLTVTENRNPAAPPPGFTAVEPVSYKINLAEGAQGVTLSKVDYIINPGIDALDISKGQIGRLFPELNAFIIDPALGELEFEAEENELTLTVANMNGEFAVFLPQAAGAGNATTPPR
ncbi:hypothetical protein CDEST_04427 [Colletotrichum destructivum]|uniref:Accumulation-associated protein n=1 Tax=Colletotrichum destructivum TaxID=34406 RepID=A0AAX4I7Q7_9PEZI|nr:hypothetical protein CDEST_04427 [Colletotrichum destructivum]